MAAFPADSPGEEKNEPAGFSRRSFGIVDQPITLIGSGQQSCLYSKDNEKGENIMNIRLLFAILTMGLMTSCSSNATSPNAET
ncbi:MAG: hypothetical protein ACU84H_02880 [Gammaproteobacteria bacterium]